MTLLKLESESGSGSNNLQLVVNSLKSLDLPKMEMELFDGFLLISTSLVKWQVTGRGSNSSFIIAEWYLRTPYDNVNSFPRKAPPLGNLQRNDERSRGS